MIADPADLLGTRALDKGDPIRRGVILEKFREGESTGSTRTSQESGTVSQAISN
jgi:pilus assembly protein CpaD